jgi:hypothetical protein
MKKMVVIAGAILALASCAKLPTYYSLHDKEINFEEVNYSGYDKDSGLRWLIFHTDSSSVIWLDSRNPVSIRKILYSGFKVHIDPEGKKNKAFTLEFPLKTERTFTLEDFKEKDLEIKLGDKGIYERRITEVPKMARYKVDNKLVSEYNYLYEENPSKLILDTEGLNIIYKIELPHSKYGIKDFEKFSVGFESGALNLEYPDDATTNSMPNSPNPTSPVVGGGIGRSQQNLRSYSQIEAPIKYWFKVEKTSL